MADFGFWIRLHGRPCRWVAQNGENLEEEPTEMNLWPKCIVTHRDGPDARQETRRTGAGMKITEEEQHMIVGALDSLGVALADHDHQWTEGERCIYEAAVECVQNANMNGSKPKK